VRPSPKSPETGTTGDCKLLKHFKWVQKSRQKKGGEVRGASRSQTSRARLFLLMLPSAKKVERLYCK